MRDVISRVLGKARGRNEPDGLERLLRERFRFLEERQGFELAASRGLPHGALAGYANRPAGRAVAVFARRDRGAWAGVGSLARDGRLAPVNRETIARGIWREVHRVELGQDADTLEGALAKLAASLGGTDA